MEQTWNLDAIGITEDDVKKEDCPQPTWNKKEGRYEMGLLRSSDRRPVTNFQATSNRTNRMMEKLDDAKLLEYNEQLKGLYQDSVIEDSIQSVATSSAFLLPHRGLHRNGKLRIVFDGSGRDGAGVSLNGYLKPGENLLHRLVAVLEFRTRPVACQIRLSPSGREGGRQTVSPVSLATASAKVQTRPVRPLMLTIYAVEDGHPPPGQVHGYRSGALREDPKGNLHG